MTIAVIYLVAAIITLLATSIPLITAFVRWATGKGIMGLIFSSSLDLVALILFVLGVIGWFWAGWSKGHVGWCLVFYLLFAMLGFSVRTDAPRRFEIATIVLQIAIAINLLALSVISQSPSEQKDNKSGQPSPAASATP